MLFQNIHKVIGMKGKQERDYWVLNAERIGIQDGEETVFTDEVHVYGKAPSYSRVLVVGHLQQFEVEGADGETVKRTYLLGRKIEKANKDEYANLSTLIGDFYRWRMFYPSQPDGTPLGVQLVNWVSGGVRHMLRAILFDSQGFRAMTGWDTMLRARKAKRAGSNISFTGRLRVYNDRLEMVAEEYDVISAAEDEMASYAAEFEAEDAEAELNEFKTSPPQADDNLATEAIS